MKMQRPGCWSGFVAAAGLCGALMAAGLPAWAQETQGAGTGAAKATTSNQAAVAGTPPAASAAPKETPAQPAASAPADSPASAAQPASAPASTPSELLSAARCTQFSAFCDRTRQLNLAVVVALLYLGAMLVVRWQMIARPARALLEAEILAMRRRAEVLAGQPAQVGIVGLLEDATAALASPVVLDWLFWSRGQEHAAWQLVHEAKERWCAAQPPEALRASLIDAEAQLRALGGAAHLALAESVKSALAETPIDLKAPDLAVLRSAHALLRRITTDSAAAAMALQAKADAKTDEWAAWGHLLSRALAAGPGLARQVTDAMAARPTGETAALLQDLSDSLLPEWTAQGQALTELHANSAATVAGWQALAQGFEAASASLARPMARRIEAALAAVPLAEHPRWRALAEEACNQVYEQRDTEFADIASWHKKTSWLVAVGLMLIVVLAAQFGHVEFFLLGALGGLLGRLSRTQDTRALPTDYGAYWTTLFLSPVVGALTGWGCLLLVAWAVELKLLGKAFELLVWDAPHSLPAMGAALLFGALERGFVAIVSKFEETSGLAGKPAAPAPAPASATASGSASVVAASPARAATAVAAPVPAPAASTAPAERRLPPVGPG
jgi:hypothetical protein